MYEAYFTYIRTDLSNFLAAEFHRKSTRHRVVGHSYGAKLSRYASSGLLVVRVLFPEEGVDNTRLV